MPGLVLERSRGESVTIRLPTDTHKLLLLAGAEMVVTIDGFCDQLVKLGFFGPADLAVHLDDVRNKVPLHAEDPHRRGETRNPILRRPD